MRSIPYFAASGAVVPSICFCHVIRLYEGGEGKRENQLEKEGSLRMRACAVVAVVIHAVVPLPLFLFFLRISCYRGTVLEFAKLQKAQFAL
jgi:hypothetical protein